MGGRERCTGYNLNHMLDLKKTASFSYNHGIIALVIVLIIKHIHELHCFSLIQM